MRFGLPTSGLAPDGETPNPSSLGASVCHDHCRLVCIIDKEVNGMWDFQRPSETLARNQGTFPPFLLSLCAPFLSLGITVTSG